MAPVLALVPIPSIQEALIYLVMIVHLLAFSLTAGRQIRAGWIAYAVGFTLAAGSVAFRWGTVGHVPLQMMFEVFLVLAMVMSPLSAVCKKLWKVGGQQWDMLVAAALLVPAAFVFPETPRKLPPALQSDLFIPHVMAYMLAYVLMIKATVQAICQLSAGRSPKADDFELASYRVARLGLVLLTGGLLLGAWWGKMAWGGYWNWDSKEMWSLATWLVYLAYFHFRALYGRRHARVNAILLFVGLAAIIFTLVGVTYLLPGMHSYAS